MSQKPFTYFIIDHNLKLVINMHMLRFSFVGILFVIPIKKKKFKLRDANFDDVWYKTKNYPSFHPA